MKSKIVESLSYTVEVTDKAGKLLKRISAPSRSYCKGWNQVISRYAGVPATVQNTAGVNKSLNNSSALFLACNAAAGAIDIGIRIGKGSTAVTISDYKLESACAQGTGVDQFQHLVVTFTEPSVDGSTISHTIKRVAVNNSGADIEGIREIGCYNRFYTTATAEVMLGFRDVLPASLTIPDGGAITVTYTLRVTV
ncbi:hypothetical protein ES703_105483 [subsurface metagenome]